MIRNRYRSFPYPHALLFADDIPVLQIYLHSKEHKHELQRKEPCLT